MNGKGSARRRENSGRVLQNWDAINWSQGKHDELKVDRARVCPRVKRRSRERKPTPLAGQQLD